MCPSIQRLCGLPEEIERPSATWNSLLNLIKPPPMLMSSSRAIASNDHIRLGCPSTFGSRPASAKATSGPTTTPLNMRGNLKRGKLSTTVVLSSRRLSCTNIADSLVGELLISGKPVISGRCQGESELSSPDQPSAHLKKGAEMTSAYSGTAGYFRRKPSILAFNARL